MKKRNQSLRRKVFERDSFACQKCKIQDKTGKKLEAHHIIPLYLEGNDEIINLITLCLNCHHYAPNNKSEFEEYIKEEMDGSLTILMKSWKKVIQEHSELFNNLDNIQKEEK